MAEVLSKRPDFSNIGVDAYKRILSTENLILGLFIGLFLVFTYLPETPFVGGHNNFKFSVDETLWVALYLTMAVARKHLRLPVFFPDKPRLSTFTMIMFCGLISLVFDSFAVILLFNSGIVFLALKENTQVNKFDKFTVKVLCTFVALTVGGGFYLGELWGLPYYISNGLDNPLAGLPLLIILVPFCAVVATFGAWLHPVRMEAVTLDRKQVVAYLEFAFFLLMIIATHHPGFSIGVMLVYSGMRNEVVILFDNTVEELKGGGFVALSLVAAAAFFDRLPETNPSFQGSFDAIVSSMDGVTLIFWGMLSSPFAGALASPAHSLQDFYANLIYIMVGAPVFVFSSLVAIMVFKERLAYDDLPKFVQLLSRTIGANKTGFAQEALMYTIIVVPLCITLAVVMLYFNSIGLFSNVGHVLGLQLGSPVVH